MKPARPPSEATPTAVLAPEPPEMIVAGPMAPKSVLGPRLVDELHARPCERLGDQEGVVGAGETSTMALPRTRTSIGFWGMNSSRDANEASGFGIRPGPGQAAGAPGRGRRKRT